MNKSGGLLERTLERAVQKRLDMKLTTDAVRLVNGRGDDLPGITIDRYNKHNVIQVFEAGQEKNLETIERWLTGRFDTDFLIVKYRVSSDGRSLDKPKVRIAIEKSASYCVVEENGCKFQVDLNDTVHTGLFLDMRRNRQLIGSLCKDKSLLNCFSYTCSFGVYARRAKAKQVVNVDISAKALERGKENYRLNDLPVLPEEFVRSSSQDYMNKAQKKGSRFDIVILDPPSFARYDKKVFSVKKDLPSLVERAVKLINPGGHLFVSTNCAGISANQLKNDIIRALPATPKIVKKIHVLGQDADFPGQGTMKESYLAALLADFC